MTEEEAARLIEVVCDGLSGPRSIPVKLRIGEGLDREQLAVVLDAMERLDEHYEGKEMVPKRLAAALLDIHEGMEQGLARYSSEEKDAIEEAAMELATIASAIVTDVTDDEPDR